MFKKSRARIVVSIMSILVLLWIGTLGVIYISSYYEMLRENKQMLKMHSDMYTLSQQFEIKPPEFSAPSKDRHEFADSPMFKLSTFYTVALTYDGNIIETRNGSPSIHTDEDLQKLAFEAIDSEKDIGIKSTLLFYVADKGSYTLVTFMDNTFINRSAEMLFRYTLIFGVFALILFFFLSLFLAKKIVKPLEESYQKQKRFISDAGHELKTPVSVIGANTELLSRELGDNQWLANIKYENERMGNLITQLLELARTENMPISTEPVDFSHLTDGEVLPFESVAFESGLTLVTDIAENITVKGDSAQLKQLVSILVDNAIRHSAGGEVSLSLKKEHTNAVLSVKNCAKPIPEEECKKLFERFYRIDTARSGEGSHYGLGLSIAKAIVDAHKGKIEVFCYSDQVEFKVQIPIL